MKYFHCSRILSGTWVTGILIPSRTRASFLRWCPWKHQPLYILLKRRQPLKGLYLPAISCWVGRMLWNILLIICSRSTTSAPERIQMWPTNVCKHLPLAHTKFRSTREMFMQQTHLFHAAHHLAHPSGLKNTLSKIPVWIYFRSQGLKEIFLSFYFTLVTIHLYDFCTDALAASSPGQQDPSKVPPRQPKSMQEAFKQGVDVYSWSKDEVGTGLQVNYVGF